MFLTAAACNRSRRINRAKRVSTLPRREPIADVLFSMVTLIALVLTPVVVILAHELGHAGFVLWASDDPVYVRVGRQPPLFTASIGRLDLSLHFLMESGAPAGFARTFASLSWDDSAAFALAGPFANIVLAFLAFPFLYDRAGHIRSGIAFLIGCSIITALANLVPYRRHGLRSDGLVALESWRGRSR
jgi:membrane-associated protease RseP (regulator of RpoE activity)